ncbi:hypothetical protein V6N13_043876 [Hibiscus sabdariffa]
MSHLLLLSLILGSLATPSLSMAVDKEDLIQQTCKKTRYFALCNSFLRSDPRSSNANLKGLALISIEIFQEKANRTLTFIIDLYKDTTNPDLSRFYGSCIEDYGTSVDRLLPEAVQALGSKDYATAKNNAAAVTSYIDACDQQFAEKTPFSDRNIVVRDLSLVATSTMDSSPANWLSELGMDEYDIIHQCHMNSLAEFNAGKDMAAAALVGGNLKRSFSSESYSSYPNFNTKTGSVSSIDASDRPTKQLKGSGSWNSSTTTEHVPVPKKPSSPTSQILSFEKPASLPANYNVVKPKDETVSSGNMSYFSHIITNDPFQNTNYAPKNNNQANKRNYSMSRSPSHAQDHILAERKRREKLSHRFIALSAIVPGLKKV